MGQRVGQIRLGSDVGCGCDGEIRQVPSVIVAKIERAGETVPCGIQPALIKGQDAKPDMARDRNAVILVQLGEVEQIGADFLHGLEFAAAHGDGAECEQRTCLHLGITEMTADLDGTAEHVVCLGIGLSLDRHQQPTERNQQFGFEQLPIRAIRQAPGKLQPALQVISGLGQAGAFRGMFTGQPIIGRGLGDQSCLGAMMSKTAGSYRPDAAVGLGGGDDRGVDLARVCCEADSHRPRPGRASA